jgi:protein-disulfide isomerase/uncharacterized membrane protein
MKTKQSSDLRSATRSRRRPVLIAALVLCIVGLGVSIELSRIHYYTHTDPKYQSICAVSDTVNCSTVAQSPFSVFWGLPISAWGIIGYTLMGFMAAWGLSKRRLHAKWPLGILFILVSFATLASAILAYISFQRIDAVCLFCMTLYTVNLMLLVGGIVASAGGLFSPFKDFVEDIKGLFKHKRTLAGFVVCNVGIIAAVLLLVTPYWHHPGWTEIPQLPSGTTPEGYHWIGAKNPLITVVEFSDYQCPYCRSAHKTMRLTASKYPSEVRLIHRHLPLDSSCNDNVKTSFHERACEFSRAAECANEQKMFWQMNDALFSIQETVRTGDVDPELLAVQLGLDRSSFRDCMTRTETPKSILEDIADSREYKVEGTPTFFIRSQPYQGGIPEGTLEAAIEQEKAKQTN